MNILYCGDVGIARGVLVSILSLVRNGRKRFDGKKMCVANIPEPTLQIYIMTIEYEGVKPFPKKTAEFLDALVKKDNPKSFVKLIDATEIFVRNLPKKNMGTYFTPCAMLRLYMDKVPELAGLDRILYLDYDVVARGDISELYDTDLMNVETAGVLDIYGRRWYHYRGLFKQDYMNSGVMLFNLKECKKSKMFEKAAKICAEKWMLLPDQSALNRAVDRRKLMSRKFNEQEERPRKDTVLHHFSNNFKFWPYFRVQKVKPFEIEKIHEVLKITEYDDILEEYEKLKEKM
jgi:lipopolysaccharide biosynthesis glycosyltransferase